MSASQDDLSPSRAESGTNPTPSGAAEPDYLKFRQTPSQILERRRNGQTVYVFDLRTGEDFEKEHLPGAYSLPYEHIEPNLHRLPFAGDLLFYDGGQGTARQTAALLNDNGFTEFYFMEEGYEALKEAMRASPDEVNYGILSPAEKAAKVEQVLDSKVRDFLARDGGGMEVVGIEESRVTVSYSGACGSCSSSTTGTLRFIQNVLTVSLNHEIEVMPVEG